MPELASLKTGRPTIPRRAYRTMESVPRRAPRELPTRSTASVWAVMGTGHSGTCTWAAMAVSAAPAATRTMSMRTPRAKSRSASVGRPMARLREVMQLD